MAITRYVAFVLFLVASTFMAAVFDARMNGDATAGVQVERAIRSAVEKVQLLADEARKDRQ
ncbi:MAG: hypothetical protein OEV28_06455 [Nitrospirota bacterium]|nr:hypothetical protein [Nitrospirota bacterium]